MNDFWHDLPRPFFILAPMEAVTDVVFRHVVAQAGAPDVWFTEFTNATGWAHAGDKAIGGRLVKTDDENPIVAQLWGSDPASMEKLAKHCAKLGYQGIDINMGCPDSSAVKSGGGAGMILNPENAAAMIAAAKTSGLPVSVKTRLGYSRIDEWHDWIAHILRQDIVNFTIHLRTKKEMSKVPAHYELIPDIKALRDQIAPHTLLTINGDIRDRAHGLELVEKYGVDGVMIGRGIFTNPFAFAVDTPFAALPPKSSETASRRASNRAPASVEARAADVSEDLATGGSTLNQAAQPATNSSPDATPARVAASGAAPTFTDAKGGLKVGADSPTGPASSELRVDSGGINDDASGVEQTAHKQKLLNLLNLQLDLHDHYSTPSQPRRFEPLKRFFKIYIRDFSGASELRDQLMHTSSTDEVRAIINQQK